MAVAAALLAGGAGTGAYAANLARPVFACPLAQGSVAVTVLGETLTLRLYVTGRIGRTLSGDARQRTVLYRQERYAGLERQIRFVSGGRSYTVYSMAGNRQTGAEPVSGVVVLLGRAVQADLPCVRHAGFADTLDRLALPQDAAAYSAM